MPMPEATVTSRLTFAVACIGMLAAACDNPAATPAESPKVTLVLEGGNVITGASRVPIDNGVVLIAGDAIVGVGMRETLADYDTSDARVIDVSGHWLIPGLMDLHAHPGSFDGDELTQVLETLLALGITSIRSTSMTDRGGGPDLRDRIEAGEIVGPRLWVAGPLIDLSGSQFSFAATVASVDEMRVEVRRQVSEGVDFIKLYSRLDRELVAAALQEADTLGVKVLGHLGRTGWMEAARLGIDGLTHSGPMGPTWELLPEDEQPMFREMFAPGSNVDDELFLRWVDKLPPAPERLAELADVLRDNDVEVNPNLVLIWAITYGREQSTFDALETQLAPQSSRDAWGSGPPNPMAAPEEFAAPEARMYASAEAVVRFLHQHGVLLTAGSDFPMPWITPGVSLHVELQRLQAAGIAPLDVLRIATANGARALDAGDRLGTIEHGKLADIVVLSANPLDDIANTRSVTGVVKDGVWHDSAKLLAQLE